MHDDDSGDYSSSPGFVPFMFLILFAAALFGVLVSSEAAEIAALSPAVSEVSSGN